MAWWFVEKIEEETGFLNDIWFFEEAHFLLHDQVNSRNNVYWGTVMPDSVHQRPLHLVKCKARCAMSKHGIIGSFWFEDVDCIAMTSDWARHWSWKEELSKRRTMVSSGSGYQSSCKWVPWVRDKPLQWERLVDASASTGLHIPLSKQTRFFTFVDISRTDCARTTLEASLSWNKQSQRKFGPSHLRKCQCVINKFVRHVPICSIEHRERWAFGACDRSSADLKSCKLQFWYFVHLCHTKCSSYSWSSL